jgi:serine/threonine protein kinase
MKKGYVLIYVAQACADPHTSPHHTNHQKLFGHPRLSFRPCIMTITTSTPSPVVVYDVLWVLMILSNYQFKDHPNIVRLEEVYESHSEIYLVQEVCKGGELFDRLDEQPDFHYTEAQCARLVKQMLSSVRYIHNKGIIHRDLKLENFLFSDLEMGSELKMIDFGLSKHFTFGEVHHEAVGTPYTVAPEVIRGSSDERCDVWAIGECVRAERAWNIDCCASEARPTVSLGAKLD